jgi:alpha-galactosidase
MWNYDYNLELGRFQRPGNWDDADFIIGGDPGLTLAETRTQLALWSMMSAPLILSSDLERLSPQALEILGNRAVLSVDQDALGRMATLLRRSPSMDLLLKPLEGGHYAVAVLNRSSAVLHVGIAPRDLGFDGKRCRLEVYDLWRGARHSAAAGISADIEAHDTGIWKIGPSAACGAPARSGAVTLTVPNGSDRRQDVEDYTRCLAAPGTVQQCMGTAAQMWRVMPDGTLRSRHECLTQVGHHTALMTCRSAGGQRWSYTLLGNLINRSSHLCLTGPKNGRVAVESCGHNLASQIWSLPSGAMSRGADAR